MTTTKKTTAKPAKTSTAKTQKKPVRKDAAQNALSIVEQVTGGKLKSR